MGFFREELRGHEGYPIGFVAREGTDEGAQLYRELQSPGDTGTRQVDVIAAGCECGWRSASWKPAQPTRWVPFSVFESEEDEARVHALWAEHVDHVQATAGQARAGSQDARLAEAVLAAIVVRAVQRGEAPLHLERHVLADAGLDYAARDGLDFRKLEQALLELAASHRLNARATSISTPRTRKGAL
ncbi:hypothetical protein FJV41_31270 [Myxococcus llanfairpwllgwyngyllgogerychwyrndrobwllllantysiliogogogochensis]|uniref:Uncharacterized protein n=1 Tax=Myxococcus llanfairpwllgwyngyllgogerychwyrndrobwllllantysiliogogogochensis TaxID=2590453 RepID=A0A540WSP6_9BACT|nr:hypothetical protein [Myxococcus llanfairpwllgwyngyllgogerychwyrndrobwllllantysiliogogogochensis]TQF12009.1 hypothetical protein FJV41_31270 [Myxococcus llanfairpwllgwyngyllgogerychwyrndrobwllllantysiliogogogochensis]